MTRTPIEKIKADYYTTNEAAKYLGRDRSQVWRYIKAGILPAELMNMQWFVLKTDVRSFTPPPVGNPNFQT